MRTRICRQCGRSFEGGPRAWYCPGCRKKRARMHDTEHRKREQRGEARRLGSTDVCRRCGKEYTVKGGNQKYCPTCAPKAVREIDRRQGLSYYHDNKNIINPPRKYKRRKPPKICVVCGKEFKALNCAKTCSPECKRIRKNEVWRNRYHRLKK